jgi:hypothetical protein
MSGNVWSCADYEILRVEQKNDYTEYKVTLQRLPKSSYAQYTVYNLPSNEADDNNVIQFPANLAIDSFLANVVPSVNTYLVAIDAVSFTTIS